MPSDHPYIPSGIDRALDLKYNWPLSGEDIPLIKAPRKSLVFPARTKRITKEAAAKISRLSSSANDSDAMIAFLADGGKIEVLPTKRSAGYPSPKDRGGHLRVSPGHPVSAIKRAAAAHNNMARIIAARDAARARSGK